MVRDKAAAKSQRLVFWSILVLVSLSGLLGLGYFAIFKINEFFDNYYLQFNRVLNVEVRPLFEVKERGIEIREAVKIIEAVPEPKGLETDIEKKIFEVFGIENYKMAIAVAKAESNLDCDAVNVNKNGTADLSIFQVNTLWLKNYQLAEIADCERNVEIAYEIWDRADGEANNGKGSWSPWVAAKNGAFIKYLK